MAIGVRENVLISDGKETCEGDPCAMAQQLRDQGIHVKVHVVGFDVTQEEGEQLVCIAKAGGGKYFNAESTTELREALVEVKRELVAKVEVEPAPPPPAVKPVEKVETEPAPPPAAKPAGETGLKLQTVLTEGSQPLKKDLRYLIFPSQADVEGKREQIIFSTTPQPIFRLKAGDYLARVTYGEAVAEAEVTVKAGESTEQTVLLEAGILRVTAVAAEGGKPLTKGFRTSIFAAQADMEGNRERVASSSSANPSFRLKAGQYLLRIQYGQENVSSESEVEITAGQATELTITLEAGSLRLSVIAEEGGQPLTTGKGVRYWVYEAQTDLEGNREQVASSSNTAQPLFSLKAGQYLVRAQLGERTVETAIEVKAGQLMEQTLTLGQ